MITKRGEVFYAVFQSANRRYFRSLKTNDRAEAGRRYARLHKEILQASENQDWQRVLNTRTQGTSVSTLGEIFGVYRTHSTVLPLTTESNIRALRMVVRRVLGVDDQAVDGLSSRTLDRGLCRSYQEQMVLKVDGEARQHAISTCNSILRQARSVTGRAMVEGEVYASHGIKLPDLTGWRAQRLFKEPGHGFVPISSELLGKIWDGAPALKVEQPEVYKAFLLSICCGLRRAEATNLLWSQILEVDGRRMIRLGLTKNGNPRLVPVEPAVWNELKACTPVLPIGDGTVLAGTFTDRWRHTFDALGRWLKSLGWDRRKKAHELRKHYGAQLATQLGTRTAALILGNTEPVLRAHYDGLLAMPEIQTFKTAAAQ